MNRFLERISQKFALKTEHCWRFNRSYLHVQEIPLEIVWKDDWNLTTFSAPALFHDKLAGLEVSAGLLRSYAGRLVTVQSQLDRLTNYTASLSVDPHVIGSMIRGVGDGLSAALEGAGHALESILGGTASGIVTVVSGLLQGALHFASGHQSSCHRCFVWELFFFVMF